MDSLIPVMQALMNSLGIAPPTTLFSVVSPLAALVRVDLEDDVAVLSFAAGLLLQNAFAVGLFGDRFAVGDLRFASVGLDADTPASSDPG